MSDHITRETFFRPPERERETLTIPASLFNLFSLLRNHSHFEHVFVPIRSMQFLAVVDRDEVIFVDQHGGYAVQDGEGGRLIVIAWQFSAQASRESLSEPVSIDLVHYREGGRDLHRRIMSEFPPALELLSKRAEPAGSMAKKGVILPFKQSSH
ncbi:MAG: hypothetical protein ABW101_14845 [Candidatus Thiodiazotropha sp.]